MGSLKSLYYKNQLLSIKRGNHCGVVSNAKPYFLIAVLSQIGEGSIIGNTISFTVTSLVEEYQKVYNEFEPNKKVTPITKPFFHLNSEQFYIIKWKPGVSAPSQGHTPSAKFLRENVEYAAFDDELWDLLQDKAIRDEYREAIINFFLKQH